MLGIPHLAIVTNVVVSLCLPRLSLHLSLESMSAVRLIPHLSVEPEEKERNTVGGPFRICFRRSTCKLGEKVDLLSLSSSCILACPIYQASFKIASKYPFHSPHHYFKRTDHPPQTQKTRYLSDNEQDVKVPED